MQFFKGELLSSPSAIVGKNIFDDYNTLMLLKTTSQARLRQVKSSEGITNWIFLPGGPGLGSESILPLLNILDLPGTFWLLDLPGDGSNTDGVFSKWPKALLESANQLDHVVLAAHSTGGMYALSLPELEPLLDGLVLLDSSPNAKWQDVFNEAMQKMPLPELEALHLAYVKNPNNENLKALTVASSPYLFTKEGLAAGKKLLESLPYSYKTCVWSEKHFDSTYKAKWIPKIPTLILAGEKDLLTPLTLFSDDNRFSRSNIILKSIKGAGHFPWIENPRDVAEALKEIKTRI